MTETKDKTPANKSLPTFLERSLEDILFETDPFHLMDRGIYVPISKRRQVKIGNYGIADIIGMDRDSHNMSKPHLYFTVYELKKDCIDIETVLQALRYAKGLKRYLQHRFESKYYYEVSIVLVGRTFKASNGFGYLPDFMSSLSIYTYKYEVDGIRFTAQAGYHLREEGF